MMFEWHTEPDSYQLASRLADDIFNIIQQQLARQETVSIVFSGGSTPIPMLEKLNQYPIEWSRLVVTLADERVVDQQHPQSNEAMLLRHMPNIRKSQFISLIDEDILIHNDIGQCNQRLKSIHKPYDLVILGMGSDGHTASIFPSNQDSLQAMDLENPYYCSIIHPNKEVEPALIRVTQTAKTLLQSNSIMLHITGSVKKKIIDKVMGNGDSDDYPIAAFLKQSLVSVQIYYADQ